MNNARLQCVICQTINKYTYCVGGGGPRGLHVAGEQVVLQLQLGGADQGAGGAAERLAGGHVLAADVLLHLLLPSQQGRAVGTLQRRRRPRRSRRAWRQTNSCH